MSQTDQPNTRQRRGGNHRPNGRSQHRSQGSRSSHTPDRTPREDHRDWEPVDRGRDIRRRAAETPSFFQKLLSTLTFGLLGAKSKKTSKPGTPKDRASRENRTPRPPRDARPPTAPDPEAVTSPRLHIGNLNYDAAESDLTELFNGVGQVQSVEVVYHRDTQRSKGFGFVQMLTIDEARRAVTELHGKDYMGRKMEIGPARTPGQSGERRERRDSRDSRRPRSDRSDRSDRPTRD